MKIYDIARMCHEVNRIFCESIGDLSQPQWGDAPQWQVNSAIDGVRFHLLNPEASPESSHENWLREKVETGWVYGEVKDSAKKTHPCIVPYNELPVEQQVKDHLFRAIVHALQPFLG